MSEVVKCECGLHEFSPNQRMGTLAGGGCVSDNFCFKCHTWLHVVDGKPVASKMVPVESIVCGCSHCGDSVDGDVETASVDETVVYVSPCNRCRNNAEQDAYSRGMYVGRNNR